MDRVPDQRAENGPEQPSEFRIDDLARAAGTTVRNIRAYQDRGLLPPARRRGRVNVYAGEHLDRLRMITQLLDRGHTLAGIKELLDAWEDGTGLGGVLGLVAEVTGPWSDETPERLTRAELLDRFHGHEDAEAIAAALRLGVLEPAGPDAFVSPFPSLLGVAARLYEIGVPLDVCLEQLQRMRPQVQALAQGFVEFSAVHVFSRYAARPLSDADAAEAAAAVRLLRPLARAAVDAELARALREEATRLLDSAVGDPAVS